MAGARSGRRSPRVSVIVPCYQYAEYLPRCVESLLGQPDVDVRVLVIDDCSTDETPEVAARLAAADPRVEVRRHAANRGHIATYNEGLSWADGDYVALVSADDIVAPGAFGRAAAIMGTHQRVGMVYGRALDAPSDEPLPDPSGRWRGTTVWTGARWIGRRCRTGYNCISSPEVVVRTSVHHAVGGYDPALPHSGDLEMWLRIAAVSDIAYVRGAPQAIYRKHPRSMLRSSYADPLVDLRHRKAAFDSFFTRCPDGATSRDRGAVGRALARQALWQASRAVDRDRLDDVDVAALVAFAESASPDLHRLPQWHGLRLRRALGAGRSQWFPPFLVTGAAHRARDEVGNLRWKLRGA